MSVDINRTTLFHERRENPLAFVDAGMPHVIERNVEAGDDGFVCISRREDGTYVSIIIHPDEVKAIAQWWMTTKASFEECPRCHILIQKARINVVTVEKLFEGKPT